MSGYDRLTIWEKPGVYVPSGFASAGKRIPWSRWCKCERDRLHRKGIVACIFSDAHGNIAVFVPISATNNPCNQ